MKTRSQKQTIQDLIDRLSRLNAAEEWNGPLNPSQFAALSYLGRANQMSRAPSHVADYLATTRGTASQTLKALARKDLIEETRSETDKRSIRYDVTAAGLDILEHPSALNGAIGALESETSEALATGLETLVNTALKRQGGRSFGICITCRHHEEQRDGGYCRLLNITLSPRQTTQICNEHSPS
ncbi:MAG: MarR family transcriptional regulator [Roseibium sp.]